MLALKPFEYFEPGTIEEATQILFMYGDRAKVLAGGVDLVPRMRQRKIKPECVVTIQRIPGLDYIKVNGGGLSIGALATLRSIELSPVIQRDYAVLHEAVQGISSIQVKNMGTAVGNLCVATPASDVAPPLTVLGAQLRITSTTGERIIPVENLFIGVNQTVLQPDEIVTEILLPGPPARTGSAFLKLVRTATDIAKVNVAVSVTVEGDTCQEAKVALGSVAPVMFRAKKAEEVLNGSQLDQRLIEAAARVAAEASKPITDVRSTAEYRREATRVLVRRALEKAVERAKAQKQEGAQ